MGFHGSFMDHLLFQVRRQISVEDPVGWPGWLSRSYRQVINIAGNMRAAFVLWVVLLQVFKTLCRFGSSRKSGELSRYNTKGEGVSSYVTGGRPTRPQSSIYEVFLRFETTKGFFLELEELKGICGAAEPGQEGWSRNCLSRELLLCVAGKCPIIYF
jgi:hypothetical protein